MWRDDATLLDILRAARHGYDDVDLDRVWKTVDEDLSVLIEPLERLAPRRDS